MESSSSILLVCTPIFLRNWRNCIVGLLHVLSGENDLGTPIFRILARTLSLHYITYMYVQHCENTPIQIY